VSSFWPPTHGLLEFVAHKKLSTSLTQLNVLKRIGMSSIEQRRFINALLLYSTPLRIFQNKDDM
jgi:hypothetical protein